MTHCHAASHTAITKHWDHDKYLNYRDICIIEDDLICLKAEALHLDTVQYIDP